MPTIPNYFNKDEIKNYPGHVLLDIARNGSASREWRKAAVEFLIDNKFPQVKHPELAAIVMEIQAEREARGEVEAVVESAIEAPISQGPFQCGVTTATMYQQPQLPFSPSPHYPVAFDCRHVVAMQSPSPEDPEGLMAAAEPDAHGLRFWNTLCPQCQK
jgi:hypothetical protein